MRLNLEIIIIKYYGRFVSTVTSAAKSGTQWFRNVLVLQEQLCRQMCQYYLSLLKISGWKTQKTSLRLFGDCSNAYRMLVIHVGIYEFLDLFSWNHPREAFRVFPYGHRFFLWLFEKTRLPLRPCFGGFPVKLRTHIGKTNPEMGVKYQAKDNSKRFQVCNHYQQCCPL